jgi:hypothetical protein
VERPSSRFSSTFLLLVLLGLLSLSPIVGHERVSFAANPPSCGVGDLVGAINVPAEPAVGSCATDSYNAALSPCQMFGGSLNQEQGETRDFGSLLPGFTDGTCSIPTNYFFDGDGNAWCSDDGSEGCVSVQGSESTSGYEVIQAGEWNSFFVRGSCPLDPANLGACIKIVWSGDIDTLVPTMSTALVDYNVFIVEDYGYSAIIYSQELCCGSSGTAVLSGSPTLASQALVVEGGDTITIGQSLFAQLGGEASVSSRLNHGTLYLQVTGCPADDPSCVTIVPLTAPPPPIPTPIFPFGSLLAILVPLIALAAYGVACSKMRRGPLLNSLGDKLLPVWAYRGRI